MSFTDQAESEASGKLLATVESELHLLMSPRQRDVLRLAIAEYGLTVLLCAQGVLPEKPLKVLPMIKRKGGNYDNSGST